MLALCLTIRAFLFRDTEQILDKIRFHEFLCKEREERWQEPPGYVIKPTDITKHHQQVINYPLLDRNRIHKAKLNGKSRVGPTLVLIEVFVEIEVLDFCRIVQSQWI